MRQSYLQFLFDMLDLPFLPTFTDAQFKLKTRFNEQNELTVLGLGGIEMCIRDSCGNVHFDRKQGGNQVDVIQAPRSTGSIVKPFLYYAMLQEGSMLPDMLLPDVPVNINGYTPVSYTHLRDR